MSLFHCSSAHWNCAWSSELATWPNCDRRLSNASDARWNVTSSSSRSISISLKSSCHSDSSAGGKDGRCGQGSSSARGGSGSGGSGSFLEGVPPPVLLLLLLLLPPGASHKDSANNERGPGDLAFPRDDDEEEEEEDVAFASTDDVRTVPLTPCSALERAGGG
jgi:hypothetical protein